MVLEGARKLFEPARLAAQSYEEAADIAPCNILKLCDCPMIQWHGTYHTTLKHSLARLLQLCASPLLLIKNENGTLWNIHLLGSINNHSLGQQQQHWMDLTPKLQYPQAILK